MKQNELTYEKFCQAVEELKKEGKNFTSTRTIGEKIGGSYSTIMRMKHHYLAVASRDQQPLKGDLE